MTSPATRHTGARHDAGWDTETCRSCGKENFPGAYRCNHCGIPHPGDRPGHKSGAAVPVGGTYEQEEQAAKMPNFDQTTPMMPQTDAQANQRRQAGFWADTYDDSVGLPDATVISVPETGEPEDDTAMFEPGEIEGDWSPQSSPTTTKVPITSSLAFDRGEENAIFEPGQREAARRPFAEAGVAHEAMPTPAEANISVGDIFVESWGYDQTNIDFYQVTRLMGQSVEIRHIRQSFTEMNGPYGDKVVPVKDGFDGEPMVKRVKISNWGGKPEAWLNMSSYSIARPWNGQPEYQTDPVFGH